MSRDGIVNLSRTSHLAKIQTIRLNFLEKSIIIKTFSLTSQVTISSGGTQFRSDQPGYLSNLPFQDEEEEEEDLCQTDNTWQPDSLQIFCIKQGNLAENLALNVSC